MVDFLKTAEQGHLPIWHKPWVEGMLGVFGLSANLRFRGRGVVGEPIQLGTNFGSRG